MNPLRRMYGLARHNLAWKMAALFASTTLWVAINGSEPNADRYLRVGVSPFGLSRRLVMASRPRDIVEVQIRGPRSILRTIDEATQRIAVDLRGVHPGRVSMKITPEMLNLPRRVRVVRVDPPRINLRVERLVRKTIPVRPVLVPPQRNGYTISEVAVTPAATEVSGPSGRVEGLEVIETEPIDTIGADGHVEREVALVITEEGISTSPDSVRVGFTVREVEGRRTFSRVAVEIREAAGTAALTPRTIDVEVRGPQRRLLDLHLAGGAVYIDASGLDPGVHSVTPQVTLPEGFFADAISPAALQLTLGSLAETGASPSLEGEDGTGR